MKKLLRIRVIAPHGCWISECEGEPGRTRCEEHAKLYSHKSASRMCEKLKKAYHHRDFTVEPAG